MKKLLFVQVISGLLGLLQMCAAESGEQTSGKTSDLKDAAGLQQNYLVREETVYTEVFKDLKESKNLKEFKEKITAGKVIDFIALYKGELHKEEYKRYEGVSHAELFANYLEAELKRAPIQTREKLEKAGWYPGPDNRCSYIILKHFPYEEESWNAVFSTLRKKHEIARRIDRVVRKARDAITLSYESERGVSVKARPVIMDSKRIKQTGTRIFAENIPLISSIDSKIMISGDVFLSIGKDIDCQGRSGEGRIFFGYESKRDAENSEGGLEREQKVYFSFWRAF